MAVEIQSAATNGWASSAGMPPAGRPNTDSCELSDLSGYSLRDNGFVAFSMEGCATDTRDGSPFAQLLSAFEGLPPDPYANGTGRFRRYDHAVILPWSHKIDWVPPVAGPDGEPQAEYYQGSYNPEHPGKRRAFPALSEDLRANPVLQALIWNDFDLSFWSDHERALPVHVGVHMVKLLASKPESMAISSPNALHQDGEPFTFAHLVTRRNVLGGENVIAAPRCAGFLPDELAPGTIIARFDLRRPLDSYGVHDPKVSHYVAGIRQQDPAHPAERSVVLIDFAVMATVT